MTLLNNNKFQKTINYNLRILIFCCLFFSTTPIGAEASSDNDTSWYKQFIDGIGDTLYSLAWPSATYKGTSFEGISKVYGGANIKIKLHGISSFDDSSLWTEVIVKVRNGEVTDISWGRNNAILFQPGETMIAFGQVLVELNKEYSRSQPQRINSQRFGGFKFKITNDCRRPVKLAIRYRKTDNNWQSVGWWEINGNQSRFLQFSDGSYVTTNSSNFYYYAETKDGSLYWGGKHNYSVNGRALSMINLEDKEGNSEWNINCPR